MAGKLYGIGVGPGDPELMTLKAVRLIEECDIVAVPKSGEGEGVARQIAKGAVKDFEQKNVIEVSMPMTRDPQVLEQSHQAAAQLIEGYLKEGKSVAFLTLGDPAIYSTYIYVHKRVQQHGYPVEMVPGVPSFCAVAAKLNTGLAEGAQPLHIILSGRGGRPGMERAESADEDRPLDEEGQGTAGRKGPVGQGDDGAEVRHGGGGNLPFDAGCGRKRQLFFGDCGRGINGQQTGRNSGWYILLEPVRARLI